MQDLLRLLINGVMRLSLKPVLRPAVSLGWQRRWSNVITRIFREPAGTASEPLEMAGIAALKLRPPKAVPGNVMLYLHGGAYILGGPASHHGFVAQLGNAAGYEAYLLDYRLAPEHPFPAAREDALAAYRWLLQQGHAPQHIVIAGDSAGGGLALSTALAIKNEQLPNPAALVLISPWVDLTLSGDSINARRSRDPVLRPEWLAWSAKYYCRDHPAEHPGCSPLFGDLAGLPPMMIQVGTEEILFDDATRLRQRAEKAGVSVQIGIYEKMWHNFQSHAGVLSASDRALAQIAGFLKPYHAASAKG